MKRIGQEEAIGFVLIMVIVSIIFLVFLGISIRTPEGDRIDNIEISQFLESSMEYSTECAIGYVPNYASLSELFDDCLSGNRCSDGKSACEVLNSTLIGIFEASWEVSPESAIKGYRFTSTYSTNASKEIIIELSKGSCEGRKRGSGFPLPAFPGKIENNQEICG